MPLQNTAPAPATGPRLLDYDGLRDLGISYSKTHIWRLEGQGAFPKRLKLGGSLGRSLWVESEIHGWLNARIAARDSAAG